MLWALTSQDLRRGSERLVVALGFVVEEKDLVRRRLGVGVVVVEGLMMERRSRRHWAQKPVMGFVGWR